jgi:hypothetical protein
MHMKARCNVDPLDFFSSPSVFEDVNRKYCWVEMISDLYSLYSLYLANGPVRFILLHPVPLAR